MEPAISGYRELGAGAGEGGRNGSAVSIRWTLVRLLDDQGSPMIRVCGVAVLAVLVSAHVGSPDVFFAGKAGPYDIHVVVRPPQVVPGIARVTVRTPADVQRA